MVSASDVVSAASGNGNGTEPAAGVAASSATTGSPGEATPGFAFVGANLAIERDAARLLQNTSLGTSPKTMAILVYALAVAVLLAGVAVRRRAQRDTAQLRKRKQLKTVRKYVASAVQLPPREAADRIARSMRELVARDHLVRRGEVEAVIARCEHIIFSTGPSDTHDLHELVRQSLALVDEAAGES